MFTLREVGNRDPVSLGRGSGVRDLYAISVAVRLLDGRAGLGLRCDWGFRNGVRRLSRLRFVRGWISAAGTSASALELGGPGAPDANPVDARRQRAGLGLKSESGEENGSG